MTVSQLPFAFLAILDPVTALKVIRNQPERIAEFSAWAESPSPFSAVRKACNSITWSKSQREPTAQLLLAIEMLVKMLLVVRSFTILLYGRHTLSLVRLSMC